MSVAIEYPAGYERPIASAARFLLDTIVRVFDENTVVLPERRVITVGSVAVDSPVLAVMYGGLTVGPPGNELNTPFKGESPRTVVFNVELWRSTPAFGPGGREPSAALVTSTAETSMDDSWWLMQAAFESDQSGSGIVASVTPNAPQGEMVGVSMTVEQQVP